jgi:hypothetical protein
VSFVTVTFLLHLLSRPVEIFRLRATYLGFVSTDIIKYEAASGVDCYRSGLTYDGGGSGGVSLA